MEYIIYMCVHKIQQISKSWVCRHITQKNKTASLETASCLAKVQLHWGEAPVKPTSAWSSLDKPHCCRVRWGGKKPLSFRPQRTATSEMRNPIWVPKFEKGPAAKHLFHSKLCDMLCLFNLQWNSISNQSNLMNINIHFKLHNYVYICIYIYIYKIYTCFTRSRASLSVLVTANHMNH